jgi:succinyl-CoA synthetase alpha subunit
VDKLAVLFNEGSVVMVQGITGRQGSFHTKLMMKYGTKIVGGNTPKRKGKKVEGLPVFDTVQETVDSTGANTSVIFVPAKFAKPSIMEAAEAGIKLIVCITEGIPVLDMISVVKKLKDYDTTLIGPNSPGIITPGIGKAGIMPTGIFKPGGVGVISRSGTLTYEAVDQLTRNGLGQSTCIGLGGDPLIGTRHVEALKMFNEDPGTEAVVLIGEIGGPDEQIAADFIRAEMKKPVVAFIAGRTAPPGKRMGHAGAIIATKSGTAKDKIKALRRAGAHVAKSPAEIGKTTKEILEHVKRR